MNLDDELRRMFADADEHLDVPVRPDAEHIIVTGARQIRRRRIAVITAGGAAAVVALVAGGIAIAGARPEAMPPAAERSNTPSHATVRETTSPPTSTSATQPNIATGEVAPPTKETADEPASSTPEPPVTTGEQLGPTGFRDVYLGMTFDEALGTGMVQGDPPVVGASCTSYELRDGDAVLGTASFSEGGLLEAVGPAVDVHTPEGVSIGWTIPQVKAVYPDLNDQVEEAGGRDFVAVRGNRSAQYRLTFADGALIRINLESVTQQCYG